MGYREEDLSIIIKSGMCILLLLPGMFISGIILAIITVLSPIPSPSNISEWIISIFCFLFFSVVFSGFILTSIED